MRGLCPPTSFQGVRTIQIRVDHLDMIVEQEPPQKRSVTIRPHANQQKEPKKPVPERRAPLHLELFVGVLRCFAEVHGVCVCGEN